MSCALKRILQFNQAINYGPIEIYNADNQEITKACQYSWSNDEVCWTVWTSYDQYLSVCKNIEDQFYLRILLFDSLDRISINSVYTKCYSICLYSGNPFLEVFCDDENLFRPYQNLDCALQLQQQLADSVICMLGLPIYYFRTIPEDSTADYTFKEYVLHNVKEVKQLSLMIPDGTMPSSNPKFTALDFDWQTDWDVEIGKTQFATAFGDTAFPKTRDFIYIPSMKRMWSVNAAYDEKNEGLMWRSTTWKLSLIKFEDSTNITSDDDINKLIDNLNLKEYEEVFGKKEEIEQERQVGALPVTVPDHAATNLYDISMQDAVRQAYSLDEVSVINYQYNHHSNIVARTVYKFAKVDSKVTYQKGYCGDSGTLSFILQTQGQKNSNPTIIKMGPIEVGMNFVQEDKNFYYELIFNKMKVRIEQFNSYLVIIRWNKQTYNVSMEVYKYTHQSDVPVYKLRPEMYWFEEAGQSVVSSYNLDFSVSKPENCYIQAYPCMITNIKLYNKDLGDQTITESIKYTTQHESCVICDLARHFNSGHGYSIK